MIRVRDATPIAIGTAVLLLLAGCTAAPRMPGPVTPPPMNGRLDYQLGGSYDPVEDVRVVVRDWHTSPDPDRYSVCYIDAFQTQPEDRQEWLGERRALVLKVDGQPVEDPNWPDQYVMDTSTAAKRTRLAAILTPWIRTCADKGFQAVELDNLDSWMRSSDRITPADNLALATVLVRAAHRAGLAVAQKNAAVLGDRGRDEAGFDFAIAESCQRYDECDAYTAVYGRHVYEIEYADNGKALYRAACAARGAEISVIYRDRLVRPRGRAGYVYDAC